VNGYVIKLNERMKKCDELSKSIDWNKAKANRKPVEVTTNVTLAPLQKPVSKPAQTMIIEEEEVAILKGPEILSQQCKNSIAEFNRIYDQYLNISQMDVWTGKSNSVVNAWTAWCQNSSQPVSDAVKNSRNPPQELRDVVTKYNTFADDLTNKIQKLNLTQNQSRAITQFQADHDELSNGFKKAIPNIQSLESYLNRVQTLQSNLRNLGVSGHPSVVSAIDISNDSIQNMTQIIKQLKIDPNTKINFNDFQKPKPSHSPSPSSSSSSAARFCSECGSKHDGGLFCGDCGKKY